MSHIRTKPAWEIREEPETATDDLAEIRTAVQGLTTTVEQRVGTLDTTIADLRTRLDRAETTLRRPSAASEQRQEPAVEQRAFTTFLRRGQQALEAPEQRVLRVSDDTQGGYLAPEQFIAELQRNLVQFSPIRSIARVASISAPAAVLPRRVGGMTAQWVGEIQPRPETTVTFGQNRFEVREIAAWVDVSNQLLEDAVFDIAAELAFEFAEEFGVKEGAAFVNGDGVLRPFGFMADPSLAYTPSGVANAMTAESVLDLYGAVPTPYRANATWVMNSTTLGALRKLAFNIKNVAGTENVGGVLAYMPPGGLSATPYTTLLGRPVIEAPDMPDVAAGTFPIAFGDFGQGYRIFDRVALSILRDPYSQATNGMTRFHGRRRVAGGVAKSEAIRKLKIATS